MLGFLETIETKTKEDFINVLLREKCVTLRAEINRTAFGCPTFNEGTEIRENFAYTTVLSAKNNDGRRVVYVKNSGHKIEHCGNVISDIEHLLHVIREEKALIKEIKELVDGIDIWIVIPKKGNFCNGGYEKVRKAIDG